MCFYIPPFTLTVTMMIRSDTFISMWHASMINAHYYHYFVSNLVCCDVKIHDFHISYHDIKFLCHMSSILHSTSNNGKRVWFKQAKLYLEVSLQYSL